MAETMGLYTLKDKERNIDKERKIKIDISKTQYPIIRSIATNEAGWKIWGKEDQKGDANIFWTDTYVTEELIKRLKPYQRINHFPSSHEFGKKNYLSDNLKKMKTLLPEEYNFFPQTWNIPQEIDQLKSQHKQQNWYIVKPTSSSQGRGIYLTKDVNSLHKENSIVQEYICSPCLIDNYKFDLRIYVFVKSLIPLKVFVFDEGLTRLATCEYEHPNKVNKANLNMHLTNYAINKNNPNYLPNKNINNDDEGHKRSLSAIFKAFENIGCDVQSLKDEIDEIIVKTVFSVYPKLLESYRNCRDCDAEYESVCFQVLGFDILIDSNMKPWIIEVNHSPSFCTDSPLDLLIKRLLILDTFVLLNLKSQDKETFLKSKPKEVQNKDKEIARMKRNAEIAFENKHMGGYHRVYPNDKKPLYCSILKKMYQKKPKKVKKQDPPQLKSLESSEIYRKTSQLLTFYGHFGVKKKNSDDDSPEKQGEKSMQDMRRQEEAIKRHIFLERDKKKIIEPIKINSVNISFTEKEKDGKGNNSKSSALKGALNNKSELGRNYAGSEIKTSEGRRKDEITFINSEIKSRIGKIKLARIKLQKIKSVDKRNGQDSGTYHSMGLSNLKAYEYRLG